MTRLIYGAAVGDNKDPDHLGGVELEIVQTLNFSRTPIYDGPTRLYDQVDYECIGYLNRGATSYQWNGIGPGTQPIKTGGFGRAAEGDLPGKTLEAIRHYMLEPRRQLWVTIPGQNGDEVVLKSPDELPCDAAAGPQPYLCNVRSIIGGATIVVHFGVRTWISPSAGKLVEKGKDAVILSHRWTRERDVDVDSFGVLLTRGRAYMNVGLLQKRKEIPDDFWDQMCVPLPFGFRRDSVQIQVLPDGSGLDYSVTDREMPVSLVAKGVTRIEATHHAVVAKGEFFSIAKQGAQWGGIGAAGGFALFGPLGAVAGGVLGFLAGAGEKSIPMAQHTISARVWGGRVTPKEHLENVGKQLIVETLIRSGVGTAIGRVAGHVGTINRDVAGRYVEVIGAFIFPAWFRALSGLERGLGVFTKSGIWPQTPRFDAASGQTGDDVKGVIKDAPVDLPPLEGGLATRGGTRGGWLGAIAAQALTRTGQRQPIPLGLGVANTFAEPGGY